MIPIPAIDIIDGKIVRLTKGKFNTVKEYKNTPLEQSKFYESKNFPWLHLVDLSGSKDGKIETLKIIKEIKNTTNLKIEFGGGIRTKDDVKRLIDLGVDLVIIGSLSIINKSEFESILNNINPSRIMIAADVLDMNIMVKGWTENSAVNIFDHIEYCSGLGIENYLCTDIAVDGMLTGPNIKLYDEVIKTYSNIKMTASGGVKDIDDVYQLNKMNLRGVVIGKAIYENKIKIEELATFVK